MRNINSGESTAIQAELYLYVVTYICVLMSIIIVDSVECVCHDVQHGATHSVIYGEVALFPNLPGFTSLTDSEDSS